MLQTHKYFKTFSDLHFCNKFIFVQKSPQQIVGFHARIHSYNRINQKYGINQSQRPSKKNRQYSYIITNSCFVHISYLHMYTYELPRRLYNFVELHSNCEDLFFAGMVGEFLRKSEQPCCIWVEGHVQHLEKIGSKFYFKYNCNLYILYILNKVCLYYTIPHNKKHTYTLSYQVFIQDCVIVGGNNQSSETHCFLGPGICSLGNLFLITPL